VEAVVLVFKRDKTIAGTFKSEQAAVCSEVLPLLTYSPDQHCVASTVGSIVTADFVSGHVIIAQFEHTPVFVIGSDTTTHLSQKRDSSCRQFSQLVSAHLARMDSDGLGG
jgi:hypothetical protein